MNRTLAIFRKDARRLWPHTAIFLALLVLTAWFDPTYHGTESRFSDALSALLPLGSWNLVIALIHEEKLPGDRQYWITRPISWQNLLGAKALFAAAFINLPVLVCHASVLAVFGISAFAWLPVLLWRQTFFTVFYVLPVAALAALTRNLAHTILGALLILLPLSATQQFAISRGAWLRPGWITPCAVAVVLAAGGAAILALQYSRRRTGLARMAAAVVALSTVAVTFIPVEKAFAGRRGSTVRIALDFGRGRPVRWQVNGYNSIALEIPVRTGGLDNDEQFLKQGMSVRMVGPAGEWRPRTVEGGLHEVSNGQGWLSILVDRDWFQAMRNTPVDLNGTIGLLLFGEAQAYPAPRGGRERIPALGVCGQASDDLGRPSVRCFSPAPRTSLYLGARHGGANWIVPHGLVEDGIPTEAGFQFLRRYSTQLPMTAIVPDSRLIASPPVGRAEAEFEFHGVRLAEFAPQ